MPVFSSGGSSPQCLFAFGIQQPIQPVVELFAGIMLCPVRLEPDMLVAAVVEADAALADGPAARPMALEVAFLRIHLIHGLLEGLSRLSRIYS